MRKRSYSASARGKRIVRSPFWGGWATVVMPSSRCEDGGGESNLTSRNRARHSTPLQTINRIRYNQDAFLRLTSVYSRRTTIYPILPGGAAGLLRMC